MGKKYFAAEDADVLASRLEEKMHEWSQSVSRTGLKDRWIKSYRYYYGRQFNGQYTNYSNSSIQTAGDGGELKLLTVNHYRNLLKHLLILTTNQKPAFDVRAINSDVDSLNQAKLGTAILDAYFNEKRLGRYLRNAAEHGLVFGKGFIHISWEPSLGRPYTTSPRLGEDGHPALDENGQVQEAIQYEGDVDVCTPSPFDVYIDQSAEDFSKIEWCQIRMFKNKFNLAARYPEQESLILALETKSENNVDARMSFKSIDETSEVPVYAFYHLRTDALPNGRYTLFCGDGVILYDGPMPYKRLPLFRIVPGEIFGTTEGYTDGFDLMGLQEALNTLASTVFSNESAFGLQNVLFPEGCNLSALEIADGLRGLQYNPNAGKPEPLQLTQTPEEIFKFMGLLEQWMETLSGVNSVARGNPESQMGKNSSGAAMALIQSMAVQFASGFQQSWAELLEDGGSFILDLLKTFAKTERMIGLGGRHNKSAMASFTGDKISNVDRVIVDVGNPLSKTVAGRVQMAENYLEKGFVKTPQEYITVIQTGNIQPLIEGPETQVARIHKENEALMDGKPVQALVGDTHLLDCQEHLIVVNDPQLREAAAQGDPKANQIIKNTLDHIQRHKELYQTQDPFFSQIAGEPPSPPKPQGPPPGPPQGGPPPPGPPPGPMAPHMGPPGPPMPMPPQMPPGAQLGRPANPAGPPPGAVIQPNMTPPPGPR